MMKQTKRDEKISMMKLMKRDEILRKQRASQNISNRMEISVNKSWKVFTQTND